MRGEACEKPAAMALTMPYGPAFPCSGVGGTECSADGAGVYGIFINGVSGNAGLSGCGANRSESDGISVVDSGGNLTIRNCAINQNPYGIVLSSLNLNKSNVLHYNNISENGHCALSIVNGSYSVEAENNWRGDDSGPTHPNHPGGSGDEICENASFTGSVNFAPRRSGPFDITIPCCCTAPSPIPSLSIRGVILLAVSMAGSMFRINKRRKKA